MRRTQVNHAAAKVRKAGSNRQSIGMAYRGNEDAVLCLKEEIVPQAGNCATRYIDSRAGEQTGSRGQCRGAKKVRERKGAVGRYQGGLGWPGDGSGAQHEAG